MCISNMRVYELSRQMGISTKELLALLASLGIEVKNQLGSLDEATAERVIAAYESSKLKAEEKAEKAGEKKSEKHKAEISQKQAPAEEAKPAAQKPAAEPKPAQPAPQPTEKPKKESTPVRDVFVEKGSTIEDVAAALGVSAGEAVKRLISEGLMLPADRPADDEVLLVLGEAFGVNLDWAKPKEEEKKTTSMRPTLKGDKQVERSPIVTVMGHVDHGKTSTLDAIRKTRVTEREAGGITQHIGASHVTHNGKTIVFLDTPGHAAFTSMRARGAQVTDIAVLVVAADDGVMPQTVEAINHAKAAGVPIIVAINKMDKPSANPDQVKQQLGGYGLVAEDWGGDTPMVQISAKSGKNIDELLEMILLVAEMEELKADPTVSPEGVVIESRLDRGKGAMASVIVQQGTLHQGDVIVMESCWGKVRAMFNDAGKSVRSAGPSTAVEVLGMSAVPQPGEKFYRVESEKKVRDIFSAQEEQRRNVQNEPVKRMTLEDLYSQMGEGEKPVLSIVLKCDVQGTTEAIVGALEKLSTNEVSVALVHTGVGRISESDVMLASASNAVIIGFNVRPDTNAEKVAERENVQIRLYQVIYDIMDDVKAAMEGLLKPKITENRLGEAEIRADFRVPKVGRVAGCMVTDGTIKKNASVRLIRDGVVVWTGAIASLRRVKDEASEVKAGFECGMTFTNFQDFHVNDVVECYEVLEEKRTL